MNNDLYQAETHHALRYNPERFNATLNSRLGDLAKKWGVVADTDPKIDDVRKAAQNRILGWASFRFAMLRNDAPFEDHRSFFESMKAQDFSTPLYGTAIKTGTDEEAEAKKFLKNFAYHVGDTVIGENDAAIKVSAKVNQDPEWIHNGLTPTEYAVRGTDVTEIEFDPAEWGAETRPAALPRTERETLREEKDSISKIIAGASVSDLETYLKTTLRPRFAAAFTELREREANYPTKTNFQLREGTLIDFKDTMGGFIRKALRKIEDAKIATEANDAPVAPTAPQTTPMTLEQKLEVLEKRINRNIELLSGQGLRDYKKLHLEPKAIALNAEIKALIENGNDPVALDTKQKHMAVIIAGTMSAFNKLTEENRAKPAPVVVTEPVSAVTTVRKPPAYVPTLTEVVKLGPVAAAKAAFINANQQDKAFVDLMASLIKPEPVKSSALALNSSPEPVFEEVATRPVLLSSKAANAETISFKTLNPTLRERVAAVREKMVTVRDKIKENLHHLADGRVIVAGVTAAFVGVIYAGLSLGFAAKDSNRLDEALAKAAATNVSAKADFNQAANDAAPNPFVQPTLVVVTPPTNDVSVQADTQPVVDRTLEEEEAFQAKTAKAEAAKLKTAPYTAKASTTVKAKADFKPAAVANDDQVTYTNTIIAKPFDIATSRVGLDTWNGACTTLKARGVTVDSGLCP